MTTAKTKPADAVQPHAQSATPAADDRSMGGSYTFDPATGVRTLQARTEVPATRKPKVLAITDPQAEGRAPGQ